MAMTGMRTLTKGLGLVDVTPPEEVANRGLRAVFARVAPERRDAALELAHWVYGGAAALGYAGLPASARGARWSGPLYGLATWALFEAVIGPLLGAPERRRHLTERALVAADHVLYGAIVAAD